MWCNVNVIGYQQTLYWLLRIMVDFKICYWSSVIQILGNIDKVYLFFKVKLDILWGLITSWTGSNQGDARHRSDLESPYLHLSLPQLLGFLKLHLTIYSRFIWDQFCCSVPGADPGEVKWVNFHPPFFWAPFFLKILVFRRGFSSISISRERENKQRLQT